MVETVIFSVILVLTFFHRDVTTEMVSMKIVEEPSSYGLAGGVGSLYQTHEEQLKMRVKPANFSGPSHFRRLIGKCFIKLDENYKYEFCPFSNITQHEQSLRWNPYSGVLGVWQEWEIENNTFTAMLMREGDTCGDIFRSMKVLFECSNKSEIVNVTEPETCQYNMVFRTPLVCHPHAMLVYPTMSPELKEEWNELEGELFREEITLQGYKKKLRSIFEKAGFYMSKEKQKEISLEATKKETLEAKEERGEYDTLAKCTEEVQKLRKEVTGLRAALEISRLADTKKDNRVANITDQSNRTSLRSESKSYFPSAPRV